MKKTTKTPLWQAIAQALHADIADKIYVSGDKLPTEAELALRFGVNRHTVRHALKALIDDGLVRTRRGAGAFVTGTPTEYPIGKRVRFHQNVLADGRTPEKRMLHIEERAASEREADVLQLGVRPRLCVYHGLSLADDVPVALFISHFPLERLPDMAQALRDTNGVTQALERCGVADYTRASTRISARSASVTQALHLHVAEGAPLIYSTSLNVDLDGHPIEFGRTWFAGDRVTLTLDNAS